MTHIALAARNARPFLLIAGGAVLAHELLAAALVFLGIVGWLGWAGAIDLVETLRLRR